MAMDSRRAAASLLALSKKAAWLWGDRKFFSNESSLAARRRWPALNTWHSRPLQAKNDLNLAPMNDFPRAGRPTKASTK